VKKYVFLTGATGLLGRYLVRDLLLAGERVAILVRRTKKESPRQRLENLLQHWERELGHALPRPVCLEGDIGHDLLALDTVQLRWIAEHCDRVLHNAASITFDGDSRDGEPWRTNVDGTHNLLQICRELGLRQMHYVSTAYVCGERDTLVMEDDLNCGQTFRNAYEESKLQAEQIVRGADFLDHLTVYRPAVIAGDSQTGYTSTYHGLYMYLKLMAVLVRNLEPDADGMRQVPMRMNVGGDEPRNIVPVDWVSAVISHILCTPAAHDRTYHLTPHKAITTRQIIDYTGTYLNSGGVQYVGRDALDDDMTNSFEQSIYESTTMYDSYNATDPQLDTTNLRKFVSHLPCPPIDEEMIHLFMRFGDEDRWGKRRTPVAPVGQWAEELLLRSHEEDSGENGTPKYKSTAEANHEPCCLIGFDVLGPGGGQWYARLTDDGRLDWTVGLLDENSPVLQIESRDLTHLIHGNALALGELIERHLNTREVTVASDLAARLARALQRSARALRRSISDAPTMMAPANGEVVAGEVVESFATADDDVPL